MEDKIILTAKEAKSLLDKGKYIHTFIQGGMALIGCDHSRESILHDIENAETLEIGGETCISMGHALVINRRLFVEANKTKVDNLLKIKTS